ncbi:MAG: hypothetical protein GY839_11885 [candidate division Zixibacteria bacterium]|nr:hypothetical protein [candidate division Zixibacteria bacterium]
MQTILKIASALSLIFIMMALSASAEIPRQISFQGILEDSVEVIVVDSTYPVTFTIYDDSIGVNIWWQEEQDIETEDGYFTVLLGSVNPIEDSVFDGSSRYLGIQIDGEAEMRQRLPITSTAYAYRSADSGGGADDDWAIDGDNVYRIEGNVGIGTSDPWSKLTVSGVISSDLGSGDPAYVFSHNGIRYFTTYVLDGLSWRVARYDDDGNFINAPLSIARANGNINFDYGTLFVDAENDRIGIGTTSPLATLDIVGGNYDLSASEGDFRIGSDDYRLKIGVRTDIDGGDVFIRPEGGSGRMFLGSGYPYYSVILDRKGVGLGINSPEARLHVRATSFYNTGFKLETDDNRMMTLAHISRATGYSDDGSTLAALLIEDTYSAGGTPIALRVKQSRWAGEAAYFSGGYGIRVDSLRLDGHSIRSLASQSLSLIPGSGNVEVDGSVVATTYYGDGSNLTGISGSTDNDWTINGDEIYHLNGNVGIGTSNPSTPFHLYHSTTNGVALFESGDSEATINFKDNSTTANPRLGAQGNNMVFLTDSSIPRMTIASGGNVGIGTESPAAKLDVRTAGTGHGIYAESHSALSHFAAVTGRAKADGGSGVYGETWSLGKPLGSSVAVYGWCPEPGAAVGGAALGVLGRVNSYQDPGNSSVPCGVFGWATATSGINAGIWGETDSPSGFGVYSAGALAVDGDFNCNGTKSAVVSTNSGSRALYCQESPEIWFEDFGEGQLANGKTNIRLDELFLETVTINELHPMKVFVQLNDNCEGVYVKRGTTGFDIIELRDGISDARFTYRVVAKRKGFEDKRLEVVGNFPVVNSNQ